MYNDTALRAADEDVALVLRNALEGSKAGAGAIYQFALENKRRFDLTIDVEKSPAADYFGYTDVVYSETTESFLFGTDKFNVLRATAGLSLRVVLNISHADTSGQRLSTLVHEIGVHCTLLFGAMLVLNKNWQSLADEPKMKGALLTQLEGGAFSADHHHTEFGRGDARDYNELKQRVTATLDDWAGGVLETLTAVFTSNKWLTAKAGFTAATNRGEEGHAKVYWHPVVQYQELLKTIEKIDQTTADFNDRVKERNRDGGLTSVLKSFSFPFFK